MSSAPAKLFDVTGLGCAAVDDLLYVPSFPAADAKVRVERTVRQCGGLTGTALVAAARLGARCAFAGRLGTDELSAHVAANFAAEGVDVSHAPRLPEAAVVHGVIVVGGDTGSRNIFYEVPGLMGAHDTLPSAEVICESKVLFIDHYGMRGNLRAARLARTSGVAVVADFEDAGDPLFEEALGLVDHLVLSEVFALRLTGRRSAAEAAVALWRTDRAAVVVTCGSEGCRAVTAAEPSRARHYPAFAVEAADTTGCGDVFHGAYAAVLARGESIEECIWFASAAAALKAARGEIPRRTEVEEFIKSRSLIKA
jgi:sulfofructose kinase